MDTPLEWNDNVSSRRCFIDCRDQQPNEQIRDLPMTTTYESIDPSSAPEDTAYARIQKPHDSENAEAAVPVNGDYLIPIQTGDIPTAQTLSPVTSAYESTGPPAPTDDGTYTALQIPENVYEEAP